MSDWEGWNYFQPSSQAFGGNFVTAVLTGVSSSNLHTRLFRLLYAYYLFTNTRFIRFVFTPITKHLYRRRSYCQKNRVRAEGIFGQSVRNVNVVRLADDNYWLWSWFRCIYISYYRRYGSVQRTQQKRLRKRLTEVIKCHFSSNTVLNT